VLEPTAIATILGLKQMPTGSRVTFAAQVVHCWKKRDQHTCLLGDESGLIRAEGLGVERWKPGDNFRIEHGILQAPLLGWHWIRLDQETKAIPLKDAVSTKANSREILQIVHLLSSSKRRRLKK